VLLVAVAAAGQIEVGGSAIPTLRFGDVEYVPLYRVVAAAGGRYWRVAERFVVVVPGDSATSDSGAECVFTADSTSVLYRNRRIAMPAACRLEEDQLLIPAVAAVGLFAERQGPRLEAVETDQRGETLLVRLRINGRAVGDAVKYVGTVRSSLEFRLCIAAGCDSLVERQLRLLSLTGGGLLRWVGRDSGVGTVLLFSFRCPALQRVSHIRTGLELAVWARPERRVARIVLDPGHGGIDPGALGRRGTREKNLNLDIARRLKKKLEALGLQVVMTRDSDCAVALAERARLANASKADLFISVHTNWAPNRAACGFETYFLSEAKTDWERAVAARENAALEFDLPDSSAGAADQLGLILADLAQNEYLTESSELAARVHEAVLPAARVKDRGVRQANFYVLRNNYMPAVLVECGFLSNRAEEKLLRTGEQRERFASGIAAGVEAFVQAYELRANGR
jgi:N-acetylmuramoyl-L-alanine amidase